MAELLEAEPGAPPPVVVYGVIYWREATDLDDEMPALRALAANASRLLWVTTPDEPRATAERNAGYAARNAAMCAWAAAQTPPGHVRVLPLDTLATAAKAAGGEALRPSGAHFACSQRVGRGSALGAFSHPFERMEDSAFGGTDCRDVVDLALVQLMLNALQD